MKKRALLLSLFTFFISYDSIINAQNLVNTQPSTSTTNCDGSATLNTANFFSTSWYWANSSSNMIQQGGASVGNLCPGTYLLNYVDSNNTNTSYTFIIGLSTQNPCSSFTGTITTTPSTSSANCTGGLVTTITGGTMPYSYSWNGPNISSNINSPSLVNVCPGGYYVIVTDSSGCTITLQGNVLNDTTNTNNGSGSNSCANFTGTITTTPSTSANCTGGLVTTVTGGTMPYTYSWNGPNIPSNINSPSLVNVCPGGYYVIVTDSSGCTITLQGYVSNDTTNTSNNYPCGDSLFNQQSTVVNCSGSNVCDGAINLTVSGNYGPYTVAWNNGSTTYNNTNLCSGTYIAYFSNTNGCTQSYSYYVGSDSSNTSNPCLNSSLAGTVTTTPSTIYPNCNGSLTFIVTGGVAPYTYSMNGIATNTLGMATLNDLCPALYTISIIDSIGCSVMLTGVVTGDSSNTANPCANANIFLSLTATNSTNAANLCTGSITTTVTGGISPYVYSLNNGAASTLSTINNVCPGVYYITVVDGNGCATSSSVYVGQDSDSTLPLNGYVIPNGVSLDGICDGSASVVLYGGVLPYTYLYSNGSTNSSAINLCQGLQNVTITDANNNSITLDFLISSPANIVGTNNFTDSTIIDSVYSSATSNCVVTYSLIDSAYISGVVLNSTNSANVTWTVVYGSGSTATITQTYIMLNSANGIYTFVLQIYCPNKSTGQYLTAMDQYYVNFAEAGITNITNEATLVYPNPFTNNITLKLKDNDFSEISLMDNMGKVLYQTVSNSKEVVLDASMVASGNYLIVIKNNKGTETNKLVK